MPVVLAQGTGTDTARAVLDLLFLAAALLILSGGLVTLLALWYRRGRDPHTGLVAEFLAEPPDDLPPGAAGALLDERADHHDLVATLIDLAHRRIIDVTELPPDVRALGRDRRDFGLRVRRTGAMLAPFEARLLVALMGGRPQVGARARLSQGRDRFERAQPEIRDLLYRELVAHRYFRRSPEATRRRWRRLGFVTTGVAVAVGVVMTVAVGGLAWMPAVATAGLGLGLVHIAPAMPRKTRRGSEAAARWAAFRRYLADIERFDRAGNETAGDLFDRYLPYAIAFGLEREWVQRFSAARAEAPSWFHARLRRRPDGDGPLGLPDLDDAPVGGLGGVDAAWAAGNLARVGTQSGIGVPDLSSLPGPPDVSMPNLSMPDVAPPDLDLQGASEGAAVALQSVGDGLIGLLEAAGSIFDAFDS